MTVFKVLEKLFAVICIFATIAFVCYCGYQYYLNEDTSVIRFQGYLTGEDHIYPAITLCFAEYLKNEFVESKEYVAYLMGAISNDTMADIDYEEVTIDIQEYLLEAVIDTYQRRQLKYCKNGCEIKADPREFIDWRPTFNHVNSPPDLRCWTFDMSFMANPHEAIRTYTLLFNSSLFKESERPTMGKFSLVMAYPGQYYNRRVSIEDWKPISYRQYTMKFLIQNMIALKRRNKHNEKCNEDWRNRENSIAQNIIEKFECKPPYWLINTSFPTCYNQKQLSDVMNALNTLPPDGSCRSIEKIMYTYDEWEDSFDDYGDGVFKVSIDFQAHTYMEVEQVQAYGEQSLVGNAGGYVGLFLGVGLMQITTLLLNICSCTKK